MTSNQVFKKIHAVSWINHTDKLTTLGAQNVKIWPKINFWFSYFNIFMPNCMKKTFKLKFDSCPTAVKFLTWLKFQNNQTSYIPEISPDSVLKYSKITHRYAKHSLFTWFLCWKLPIDTDFIHFICQFHQSCGINAREFSWASCTSARHAGSFDCLMASLILITMDNVRGHCAYWQSCKVPNQTHKGIKEMENVCYKTN